MLDSALSSAVFSEGYAYGGEQPEQGEIPIVVVQIGQIEHLDCRESGMEMDSEHEIETEAEVDMDAEVELEDNLVGRMGTFKRTGLNCLSETEQIRDKV